jgi:anion-transporting  ArsA/GET3 family ATPase
MTDPASTAFTDGPALARLVEDSRVLICVGSGGVGKTTTAATLGLYGASIGKRTLVITIDPARRLANALGLSALDSRPKRIPDELLVEAGIRGAAPFSAMTLDLKAAWDSLVERTAKSKDAARRILENRLYRSVSNDLPGAQDFIACEALYTLVDDGQFDLIVLDTPPTQNALDFLDAPKRILDMLDSEAFRFFAEREAGAAARLGLRFLDTAQAAIHALLSRFTGASFLDELGDFLTVMRDLYEPVRDRTRGLLMVLRSVESRFVVITSPAPGPRAEALDFLELLTARGYPVGALVANRVVPQPLPIPGGPASLKHALEQIGLSGPHLDALTSALEAAHRAQSADAAHDLFALERMREGAGRLPLVVVPRLSGDIADVTGLVRLMDPLVAYRPRG